MTAGRKYEEFGRTYLFNIDGHHVTKWQEYHGKKPEAAYCIDAYHVGNFTRYLNHSCDPNCGIVPCYINEANIEKGLLTIWTVRDVVEGEELCFSYFGQPDEDDFRPMVSTPQMRARSLTNLDVQTKQEKAKLVKIRSLCQCKATRCTGRMWKFNADEEGTSDSDD
ncbi:hypothetical protein PHLGIDRAFT_75200 [Phlebiopsis gigantea 11061_1 CR5-6]|uniref:SET domain-containing protein n=1 Tax=Phlebiopsis gigantea (strain 11061_1 CR5-6) TaxID=745531 RepID=A0A0C3RUT5_PHLG1|nr:hypothetical protein PHLGIDRAFT_75200 [Phlebiopsis gigantea 11061_1 CR5-6]